MDDSALQCGRCGLSSISHTGFAQNAVDVGLYGGLAYFQELSDFLIAFAGDDLLKHFKLSFGEIRAAHPARQPLGYFCGYPTGAGMDSSDGILEFLKEHILQKVALCPGLQRAINVFVTVKGSQDNETGLRKLATNSSDRFHSA